MKATLKVFLAQAAIGWLCWNTGGVGHAQIAPADLSPDLQEVLKLSQQKMSDDVITSYVRNSGKIYKLDADQIRYLSSQGVSKDVINTMLQTESSANPAPAVPVPTTPAPSVPQPAPDPAPPAPDNAPPPPAPGAGPTSGADTAPPPDSTDVNFDYFHSQLAPFGTWVQVAG